MRGWTNVAGMLAQPVLFVTSPPQACTEWGLLQKSHSVEGVGREAVNQGRVSTAESHPLPWWLAVWEGQ